MTQLTPIKAIKDKCLDCCAGNSYEVNKCPCEDCPLFIYRFGMYLSTRNKRKIKRQRSITA
jgi:hypothetical protein